MKLMKLNRLLLFVKHGKSLVSEVMLISILVILKIAVSCLTLLKMIKLLYNKLMLKLEKKTLKLLFKHSKNMKLKSLLIGKMSRVVLIREKSQDIRFLMLLFSIEVVSKFLLLLTISLILFIKLMTTA